MMKRIYSRLVATLGVIIFLLSIWCSYQYWSITTVGENTEPEKADVIIVLGAAVWPTGPSPALQARIEHSAAVYNKGLAGYFILSGGLGQYPPSEAEAMGHVLKLLGINPSVMYFEDEATNTIENLKLSKAIMEEKGFETAIIVTDFFHLKRALMIAEDVGIEAYGSPAKNSVLYRNKDLRLKYTIREVLAITQYYFKRLIL
jgi:uncharacterized SAM-binding protein YcdF (DUF218 family)